MSDPQSTAFIGGNICRVPRAFDVERDRVIAVIDSNPMLEGVGVILIRESGEKVELRGGPRRRWIWIAPMGMITEPQDSSLRESPAPVGFWDRWGGSVLSCGSAVATGVVIGLSGGTATPLAGAFAVNSALLCGTSLGKAITYDAWKEFENSGGTTYKVWLTTETMLSLVDLFNGAKGAASFLKNWKNAGKLAKLAKASHGRNLSRAQLLRIIQQIDPAEAAKLSLKAKGAAFVSKGKLLGIGDHLLKDAQFISLSNQSKRVIVDGIGNALSVAGTPDNVSAARSTVSQLVDPASFAGIKKRWDVWLIQYSDAAIPN